MVFKSDLCYRSLSYLHVHLRAMEPCPSQHQDALALSLTGGLVKCCDIPILTLASMLQAHAVLVRLKPDGLRRQLQHRSQRMQDLLLQGPCVL